MGSTGDRHELRFTGARGQELAGTIDVPDGELEAWALFAHCFTCGKDLAGPARLARELNGSGIGVLRFDFTGLGDSEGEFGDHGIMADVEDLATAAEVLAERYAPPGLLIGHSLGGAAAVLAAPRIDAVGAVVTIGAPADPMHASELFAEDVPRIREEGEAEVSIAGQPFTISERFVDELEEAPMQRALGDLDAALLIMHSPHDEVVGIKHAEYLYRGARHPKSFVSLPDADHLLTDRASARYAARVIAAWSEPFVGNSSDR